MAAPRRGGVGAASALVLMATALLVTLGSTASAFRSQADNGGDSVTAAPDFRAPIVEASAIGKVEGGATGFVKKGGGYFLYARIGDRGNPPSGVASAGADLSALTPGAGSVPLVSGSFTAAGQEYNFRSAQQTAAANLAEGSVPYSIATLDNASNSGSENGSATVDNTAPAAVDIQTANKGAVAGKAEQGDTVTFTYSEPIEPGSILSGWSGGPTGVVVRITTGIALIGGVLGQNEGLQVFDASNVGPLPLGAVDLRQQYVAKTGLLLSGTMTFGASGAPSTMSMSGNAVTVTLGTQAGNNALTVTAPGTMKWAPATSPYDRAANSVSGAGTEESGPADVEF